MTEFMGEVRTRRERKKGRKNSAVVVVKRLEGNGNGIGTGTSPGRQNPERKQVGREGI